MATTSLASAFCSMKAVMLARDGRGMKPRSSDLQLRAGNAPTSLKMINGTKFSYTESLKRLPDWSMLFAVITTIFSAAEKQWTNLEWKPKPKLPQLLDDHFGLHGLVFRRTFAIRSYEVGPDRSTSILAVMNHMQEATLNHAKSVGILGDGFGTTLEMSKRDLMWVVRRTHVAVERYPTWGDTVEVECWIGASGNNGMRRDFLVRDCKTGEILTRCTSLSVLMNTRTRRLSTIPDEVRGEIGPAFIDNVAVKDDEIKKLQKLNDSTADYIQGGLTPRWNDLDVNQHVNNLKYVAWVFETVPDSIFESHHISSFTLEYRRECTRDSVLRSLTTVSGGSSEAGLVCDHLLQLEGGSEVLRARTEWRPKLTDSFRGISVIPAEPRV
uniref:Dodecanoyl-[acyl-carrier-protein] hydrolase, chloroplastic n=1 Tax=Umbellularia californica TaxID=3438 RepID=FATB_UMBCA|nr:RecName: Full=Dodecanoyl-[acyl-carrier-protein] hydrolase, chloroplastic; AltName: Full=12:0-acyl-carrier protein thioesterase; Short=12:0-ACP thioesterase; AltName: Full=Acyl-[acyl-carrier-protein] hydrolase; AltName: Full=BTE; AltName: Full=Lauroyl-acyl carrier protein thioesterase; AltName: Full=UcFatB1; Flags: Precursor [Umbellularia californica]AAA34215.1 thioesterase [Umbellularia californica]AKP20085.1 acyl-ACP thioesterase [synthetic construct]